MPRTNETRYIKWHETCKCKCRLDASIFNDKQIWNNDKSRGECKELIDKGRCDKGFIWNLNNCDVGEYLDYKNCKCRKSLVDKLVEECSENVDGNKMIYNGTLSTIPLNDYGKISNSCTVYIVLLVMFLVVSISISSVFIYFYWYLKRRYTETTTY